MWVRVRATARARVRVRVRARVRARARVRGSCLHVESRRMLPGYEPQVPWLSPMFLGYHPCSLVTSHVPWLPPMRACT